MPVNDGHQTPVSNVEHQHLSCGTVTHRTCTNCAVMSNPLPDVPVIVLHCQAQSQVLRMAFAAGCRVPERPRTVGQAVSAARPVFPLICAAAERPDWASVPVPDGTPRLMLHLSSGAYVLGGQSQCYRCGAQTSHHAHCTTHHIDMVSMRPKLISATTTAAAQLMSSTMRGPSMPPLAPPPIMAAPVADTPRCPEARCPRVTDGLPESKSLRRPRLSSQAMQSCHKSEFRCSTVANDCQVLPVHPHIIVPRPAAAASALSPLKSANANDAGRLTCYNSQQTAASMFIHTGLETSIKLRIPIKVQ
jgi:hypothetical protein